jgi:hypothetical protein
MGLATGLGVAEDEPSPFSMKMKGLLVVGASLVITPERSAAQDITDTNTCSDNAAYRATNRTAESCTGNRSCARRSRYASQGHRDVARYGSAANKRQFINAQFPHWNGIS